MAFVLRGKIYLRRTALKGVVKPGSLAEVSLACRQGVVLIGMVLTGVLWRDRIARRVAENKENCSQRLSQNPWRGDMYHKRSHGRQVVQCA